MQAAASPTKLERRPVLLVVVEKQTKIILMECGCMFLKMLQSLIDLRTRKGLRTILLDSEDMGPIRDMVQSTSISQRATIMLRFPSGRGRYRFLAHACRERNLPVKFYRYARSR